MASSILELHLIILKLQVKEMELNITGFGEELSDMNYSGVKFSSSEFLISLSI